MAGTGLGLRSGGRRGGGTAYINVVGAGDRLPVVIIKPSLNLGGAGRQHRRKAHPSPAGAASTRESNSTCSPRHTRSRADAIGKATPLAASTFRTGGWGSAVASPEAREVSPAISFASAPQIKQVAAGLYDCDGGAPRPHPTRAHQTGPRRSRAREWR